MATIIRGGGDNDGAVLAIKGALDVYEREHAGAQATLYRNDPASVRVRVIDRAFEGMTRSGRHQLVWGFLAGRLDADVLEEIALVLLLAPNELGRSMANFEFENPASAA